MIARNGLLAVALCAPGMALAQDVYVYNFQLEVYENNVFNPAAFPALAALEVGTTGTMQLIVEAEHGDFPDWNSDSVLVYNILEASLDVGDFHTIGENYPSTSQFLGLHVQNDDWQDYPSRILMDFFGAVMLFDHPETTLSTLIIRDLSEPNETPLLLSSTDLPDSANLNLAEQKELVIRSLNSNYENVKFSVIALEGTFIAACPADVNRDDALTPADFADWIAAYNQDEVGCDQNRDGDCQPNDFSAWLANYNTGCP